MRPWVRPAAVAVFGTPLLAVVLLLMVCAWISAAEIYWVVLGVPHHGESAVLVLVGMNVAYSGVLVLCLAAIAQDLRELRLPQQRQPLTAALIFILAFVFVAPCALVWSLGGAARDIFMIAIGSVAGSAGALLWRLGSRTRHAPGVRHGPGIVATSGPAPQPPPWRAVRLVLGPPYAPASWTRRAVELTLLCAVVAGAPALVWRFGHSLRPLAHSILLHGAEFIGFAIAIGLCWVWPLSRLAVLFNPQRGALTELALLPGQGGASQQLRRLYLVALSVPTLALVLLLVFALGMVALDHLPRADFVKVVADFLLVLLITFPILAGQLANPGAPNAWSRPLAMIGQIWPYTFIVWNTGDALQLLPVLWRWLAAAAVLAGVMTLVGMTIYWLRKVSRRPHPFVEV
jgi:hypothetical protein